MNSNWYQLSTKNEKKRQKLDKIVKQGYCKLKEILLEYSCIVKINSRIFLKVLISQHYQEKHFDINDSIILQLIKKLNGKNIVIDEEKNGFQYFVVEPIFLNSKPYKIILLMSVHDNYLGVVNAFRIQRKKQ